MHWVYQVDQAFKEPRLEKLAFAEHELESGQLDPMILRAKIAQLEQVNPSRVIMSTMGDGSKQNPAKVTIQGPFSQAMETLFCLAQSWSLWGQQRVSGLGAAKRD
eukprot:TRINITY_DN66427_c8_g2_i1.p1 TRINITY_DN66427_c8_g2~~TRINITY_DN66427_c8_g2_i1.p1  ORF type:complete len:105 (-),score=4.68 TRINITY_DN66427_c8_g2_i1:356-670(-)